MNGLAGSVSPAGPLYVRALYDYEADDRTSLSFRQGDIIQVITQLDSGWWDGVLDGVRGWFPSNYCAVVVSPFDEGRGGRGNGTDYEAEDSEEEYAEHELDAGGAGGSGAGGVAGVHDGSGGGAMIDSSEEAAFWIPQATPAGKLFFFNTLTGESSMDLPLRAPTSANETGPRDRTNIYIPEQTRPPAELMAAGYELDDDTDYTSASEAEELSMAKASKGPSQRRRLSQLSETPSPATSTDLLIPQSPLSRSRANLAPSTSASFSAMQQGIPPIGTTMNSFANAAGPNFSESYMSRRLFDDSNSTPLTWNTMVDQMRQALNRYREAITNGERSEYVRRAEDISDQLRQLLAAGSGTTDNHSGAPSIISKNKALYPHYREMMSRFSKLVLSSHIAATDWPGPDSTDKCLQESDHLLQGVYAFVDVARQQRSEDITRLTPGFVVGSRTAGNWQNNGLIARDPLGTNVFVEDDQDILLDPSANLDAALLARIQDLKRLIASSIRKLDEHLTIRDKLITPRRQADIVDAVCKAGKQTIEVCRPFLSTVESINLAPVGTNFTTHQLNDFTEEKQRMYDNVCELLLACQAVGSPLGDEWADVRGPSMEDRLNRCRVVGNQLETTASQITYSLQLLSNVMPSERDAEGHNHRLTDGGAPYHSHLRETSKEARPQFLGDAGQSKSFSEGLSPDPAIEIMRNSDNEKVKRFFGEVPPITIPSRDSEEVMPYYLRLDHEAEMAYDPKFEPPQLRGGTITGLVEHLTRHDKLDSGFNNTFLLTYQSFISAAELFAMLVQRWSIQPPHGLANDDLKTWREMKQAPIRLRVMNILKAWIEHYWMEPEGEASDDLLHRINNFVVEVMVPWHERAKALVKLIQTKLNHEEMPSRKLVPNTSFHAPAPIIPKNLKKLKFLDIDALEFARQLTIIESALYGKIKPTECLNKTWQKKLQPDEKDPAENVKALILHSNQLTNWVAQMILTQADVKRRAVVIKHFVAIADKCRSLNNFSCLTSIISALGSAPIHRLNRTWTQTSAKTKETLESMRKLMGSTKNFMEYRDTLHRANPPCIPFFGIYLTDLTFIEDGIPSIIKKSDLINFLKRAKTAEVIRDIQQYQNVPYPFQPVAELQDYILRNMRTAGDVHEMYERSLAVEPRERDDEKIAR